ncbi:MULTISPECIES: hypothetical protein [Paenibacillus]|uniref:hypothetical protein n=1 Tax=Paenibacillus TaxID=44249 RepID=UPI0022B85EB2|nr:hypothetical protein [Paenibacillus caseinilyticus]MCZ8520982.1 hypothetical protein [Paenibacillus caseinilyticus]
MKLKLFLLLLFLAGCSQLEKIQIEDIKHGGIYYERDKLIKYGITDIRIDDKVHLYVPKIKPDTRKRIEIGLIEIFGKKFDFELHEDGSKPPASLFEHNNACLEKQEIARLNDANVTVYACLEVDGYYQGIWVKSENKEDYYKWINTTNKAFAPVIHSVDLNNDGVQELIIVLTKEHGTGLAIREAHILNPKELSEITLVDSVSVLKQRIASSINADGVQVTADGKIHQISAKQIGIEKEKWFDHLYFGNVIRFEITDNVLISRVLGEISPSGFIGEAVIYYKFQDNQYIPRSVEFSPSSI